MFRRRDPMAVLPRDTRADSYPMPFVPYGWYAVLRSRQLRPGRVVSLHYFGRALIAFRGADGQAAVRDAHCPHYGAHLGVGGLAHEHHPGTRLSCHPAHVLVVGVQQREPAGRQSPDHLRLLVARHLERAERAPVIVPDGGDHDDVRADRGCLLAHLAAVADGDLEDRVALAGSNAEQRPAERGVAVHVEQRRPRHRPTEHR